MRSLWYLLFLALTANCWSKSENATRAIKEPLLTLDDNLRKALLKALIDLETEEKNKIVPTQETFQQAAASSFTIVNDNKSTAAPSTVKSTTASTVTDKSIVVLQKSKGIEHRPIVSFIPTSKPEYEQIIASASNSFTISPKFQLPNNNYSAFNRNSVSISEKPRQRDVTTPAPIITPSTEENEAKVEDVQFFAAPLVAAFTVHQDEQGLPKSVEPIYKVAGQTSTTTKDIVNKQRKQINEQQIKLQEEKYKEEQTKLQQYLKNQQQIRIQYDLQEKQRSLEQQIRSLQQQQQHQDYLLRQQQLFQEQNLIQQRQRLLEEQKVLLKKQKAPETNRNRFPIESSLVAFQPLTQVDNSLTSLVNQQLPLNKPAENFRTFTQFPVQYQALPVQQQFSFFDKQTEQRGHRGNRVFRQESGTGNFVNNDLFKNNFVGQNLPHVQQSNRFFRSNPNTFSITPSIAQDYQSFNSYQPQHLSNHLNNLLFNSGIGGGNQHEDLSIVSKVLSLNHLGSDNFFGSSQILEQKLLPPK